MADPIRTVTDMPEVRTRPLRRSDYAILIDQGALEEDDRVQLLEGELVEMSPQKPPHADVVEALTRRLARELPDEVRVRIQLPFAAGELSEPEPDVALVPADEPRGQHPESALLVIEVADSSLALDLGRKARIYADAGVPRYWVIDLRGNVVHVHTDPEPGGYRTVERRGAERDPRRRRRGDHPRRAHGLAEAASLLARQAGYGGHADGYGTRRGAAP
jgi:Uma2 family endonuclease